MEIREKLLKFKHHIVFAFVFSLLTFALVTYSPGFLTVLSYFWPLLLSTALFLAAVLFFAGNSGDSPTTSAASGDGGGAFKAETEGFLDYIVAGQPEETLLNTSFGKLE
ncbi:PREDICTED: uncharacterized protein LOC104815698 [Tarenaya hassleriana]|uniref:uncharacterized protein LOC104815698 n=1 Tax=Tarenaya hassleriana TaxID=28532 RepID=UPI00053C9204|nr:PREDICTED: uncharacterized protein LOC104815698 [Tarenaya hassleriana]